MKEIWLRSNELVGKYNLPTTVQGIFYKAKKDNWAKRKVVGIKGGGYEFEVSSIINKYNHLQAYDNTNNLVETNRTQLVSNDNMITVQFDSNSHVLVPELNVQVAAGSGVFPATEEQIGQFVFSRYWLAKEGLSNANLYLFHVVGDSMESTINDGDIILADVKNEGWTGALNGVFIILIDNMLMVKRIQYDIMNKGFHIKSDNNLYESYFVKFDEGMNFKVIAKVERILTKMRSTKTV